MNIFHKVFLRLLCFFLYPTVFLLSLVCPPILAQDHTKIPPISIDAKVDKTGVTTGDTLTFTVSIIADSDIKPYPPDFNPFFTGFEILDNGVKKPKNEGNQLKTEIWYRLRADQTGEFAIPPVAVKFSAPDPKYLNKLIQGQILTPEVTISVLSVLRQQGEPEDIRDIKPILDMEPDWRQYVLFILLLFLVLILLFIWAEKSKPPRKTKLTSEIPVLLPHELAFKELNSLRSKEFLKQGLFRKHYFELSEIFRRYLGNRYHCPALDWTTEEIVDWMQKNHPLQNSSRLHMLDILNNTDQVKYAKVQPTTFVSDKIMELIARFIQETMEKPHQETTKRQGAI